VTAATNPLPRVLCVDDDAFMLNVLTKTIGVDYEVLTSSGGAEALQLIESSAPIQVVISDHRMPDLSGAQFLRAVREKHPLIVRDPVMRAQ
jgi:CheY-like chemotaxis protein